MSHTAKTESHPCALPSDNAYVKLPQNFPPPKGEWRKLKTNNSIPLTTTATQDSWQVFLEASLLHLCKFVSQVGSRRGTTLPILVWVCWLAELYHGCLGYFLDWGKLLLTDLQTPFRWPATHWAHHKHMQFVLESWTIMQKLPACSTLFT